MKCGLDLLALRELFWCYILHFSLPLQQQLYQEYLQQCVAAHDLWPDPDSFAKVITGQGRIKVQDKMAAGS